MNSHAKVRYATPTPIPIPILTQQRMPYNFKRYSSVNPPSNWELVPPVPPRSNSSETINIKTVTESEKIAHSTVKKETIVIETWKKMSRRSKFFLALYTCTVIGTYVSKIHHDGHHALQEHRRKRNLELKWNPSYQTPEQIMQSEYQAVLEGCRTRPYSGLFESLFAPITIVATTTSKILPFIIISIDDFEQRRQSKANSQWFPPPC